MEIMAVRNCDKTPEWWEDHEAEGITVEVEVRKTKIRE